MLSLFPTACFWMADTPSLQTAAPFTLQLTFITSITPFSNNAVGLVHTVVVRRLSLPVVANT